MGLKLKSSGGTGSVQLNCPDNHNLDTSFTLPTTNVTGGEFVLADGSGNVNIDSGTLYVDAVNNRVGIGTTAPTTKLDIYTGSATGTYVKVENTEGRLFAGVYGTGEGYLATETSDPLILGTNGTERARIDTSGRLLVGTSSSVPVLSSLTGAAVQVNSNSHGAYAQTWFYGANNQSGAAIMLAKSRNTTYGSYTAVQSGDSLGGLYWAGDDGSDLNNQAASILCEVDGTPGTDTMPGRLVFSTTSTTPGASPTKRMRITSSGDLCLGSTPPSSNGRLTLNNAASNNNAIAIRNIASTADHWTIYLSGNATTGGWNGAATINYCSRDTSTNRSINAAGTINASGADYAEYMVKAGDFDIAKGAVCGVTADGLLTLDYGDAVSFVVKSTNPSYVGGDTWGTDDAIGKKPDKDENGDVDAEALAQWESDLEAARQKVDRIAFAGQVPVNVLGATPGQYVVPVEAADGGIEGIAKNEADLTLAEYMRAVGKVIAIEDDGRARIIVKVA